jgi:hypothetical protein
MLGSALSSVAIQHAPWAEDRRAWVRAMVEQLRDEAPELSIVIVADEARQGCWPTFRRALECGRAGTHHLLLQDDLELCRDFVATVNAAIEARPHDILNLYTCSDVVPLVRERGEAWLQKLGCAGPSMVWPRSLIAEFLAWQARHVVPEFQYDTVRASLWMIKTGRKSYATVPSLTQHLGAESSTLGLNDADKIALCYQGRERSGTEIDWTRGLETPLYDELGFSDDWWQHYRD